MARIRTIKPEFWASETLATVSEVALLLAISLLNFADDEGYFNANPKLIEAFTFPIREPSRSTTVALSELSDVGYIELKSDGLGRSVGRIVNFKTHQVINKPKQSELKEKFAVLSEYGTPTVLLPSGREGKGKEGKGKGMEQGSASDDARRDQFETFWSAFNYKKGRDGAWQSWRRIPMTDDLLALIIAGAKREAANRHAIIARGSTPIYAQGWLTQKRWEDEHVETPVISRREAVNRSAVDGFLARLEGAA